MDAYVTVWMRMNRYQESVWAPPYELWWSGEAPELFSELPDNIVAKYAP